jgi:uncharacterized protein (DUF2336 family)
MNASETLIGDLEIAVQAGSQERRIEMMRRVTTLFLGGADQFNSQQVELFGDVLTHLTKQVESEALAELGAKLAPVDNAPKAVIQSLARHDEIAVAGPVLAQSPRLSDHDLIEIAETKGQQHLGAISERVRLAAAVTDILVDRGNNEIVHKLSRNQGASFSNVGFTTLAKRAETDERLAESLGVRPDMPPQLLQDLVTKATEAVRSRLLALAPPEDQAAIQDVLASVSNKVMQEVTATRDFKRAEALIDKMDSSNQLNEAAILEFANAGNYEEMVVGLARLCSAPLELIERLMQNADYNGVLVACKAAKLHWPTFSAILKNRFSYHQISTQERDRARTDFLKLSVATAQRIFRFWVIRGVAIQHTEQLGRSAN